MTPQEFNQFRDNLNPASGFQSVQFRELEFAVRRAAHRACCNASSSTTRSARGWSAAPHEPSLYDRVKSLLQRRGFAVDSSDELIETFPPHLHRRDAHYDLYCCSKTLIEFDERFLLWRGRHVRMVERMIGTETRHRRFAGRALPARARSRTASFPNSGKFAPTSATGRTHTRRNATDDAARAEFPILARSTYL